MSFNKNQITIRSVPSNANPTPRPSTSSQQGRINARLDTSNQKSGSTVEQDFHDALNSIIGEDYLRSILQIDDLSTIKELKLSVNTSAQSIDDIGDILRNLRKLDLEGSIVMSVRDLGISLRHITTLSLNNCGLNELDGIGSFVDLKVLNVRDNNITDVCPLALLENLKEIDLHGNKIANLLLADALSSCPSLCSLRLTCNPISRAPKYEAVISSLIPGLKYLDGYPIDEKMRIKVTHTDILDAAASLRLLKEEQEDEERMETMIIDDDGGGFQNFQFHQRNETQNGNGSGNGSIRSFNDSTTSHVSGMLPDTGSELTHGSAVVLVGGVAAALRQRRCRNTEVDEETSTLKLLDAALHPEAYSSTATLSGGVQAQSIAVTSSFIEGDVTSQSDITRFQDASITSARAMTRAQTAPSDRYLDTATSSPRKPSNNGAPSPTHNLVRKDLARPNTSLSNKSKSTVNISTNARSNNKVSFDRPATVASSSQRARPSTAAVAPSAPFKVSIATTGHSQKVLSNSNVQKQPGHNFGLESVPLAIGYPFYDSHSNGGNDGNKSKVGIADDVDITDDDSIGKASDNRKSRRGSIVCRDTVFRSSNMSRGVDHSDSEEDIAVTHAERLEMMAKSNRGVVAPEQDPFATRSKLGGSGSIVDDSDSLQSVRRQLILDENFGDYDHILRMETEDEKILKRGISAKAGRLLGFDLKGSLAAIEQWVDAMDPPSDSEDMSVTGTNEVRHPDLKLRNADDDDEDDDDEPFRWNAKNKIKPRAIATANTTKQILSRERIMSMCIGTADSDIGVDDDDEEREVVNTQQPRHKRGNKAQTKTHQTQPDILVISHDVSYDLDAGALPPTPQKKSRKGTVHKKIIKNTAQAAQVSPSKSMAPTRVRGVSLSEDDNQVQGKRVIEEDDWDGYGDEQEALMLDFDVDKLAQVAIKSTTNTTGRKNSPSKNHKHGTPSRRRPSNSDMKISPPKLKTKMRDLRHSLAQEAPRRSTPKVKTRYGVAKTTRVDSLEAQAVAVEEELRRSASFRDIQPQAQAQAHQKPSCETGVCGDGGSIGGSITTTEPLDSSKGGTDKKSTLGGIGNAVPMSDEDLVILLNKPPKATNELRTKSSFQDFFRGMPHARMRALLERAYADLELEDRELQIDKRLSLLRDVLVL